MENITRYYPDSKTGLTNEQIQKRKKENKVNYDTSIPTKSIKSIIFSNFFTIFNLINLILAFIVFSVGSYKNMLFIGLVMLNTAISTIQEIHSKKVVDRLNIIASSKVTVLRQGKEVEIGINEIVLDDLLVARQGNQMIVDSIIQEGEVEIDESFITGEQDAVVKKKGDMILSGSFLVSGTCIAKVEHIGNDNYTSQITKEARYIKKVKSEIMDSLNGIIKTISIVIIPVGILLFLNQMGLEGNTIKLAVVNTVAAIIGMIPEGLVLLTSTVLAVSVIRLAKSKVLVQDLYCIETLARVDTLCLDKTGTITEGKLEVKQIEAVGKNSKKELKEALCLLSRYSQDSNSTIEAIREKYHKKIEAEVIRTVPFSSARKWSAISLKEKGTYLMGAPEMVLKNQLIEYEAKINQFLQDYRVIVIAKTKQELKEKEILEKVEVLGFVLILDKIRKEAKQTLQYFKEQGVNLKIISGDNPITVSKVAKQAGVEGYDSYLDCFTISDNDKLKQIAQEYTIFGRVSPVQKKELICAFKEQGHTVAMTGDGVNDVVALKEADCSIAIASGSDAARSVSQIVLLDSDFKSMPKIVAEGRRTINNIQRSASLFLSKTIYATILAALFVFTKMPYPFMPIQLSLIGLVCIGTPSFLLALERNKERVKGKFIINVIAKAIPASLTLVVNIIIVAIITYWLAIPTPVYSTLCVISTVIVGFMLLFKTSIPLDWYRGILFIAMIVLFTCCAFWLPELFSIVVVAEYVPISIILGVLSMGIFLLFNSITKQIIKRY